MAEIRMSPGWEEALARESHAARLREIKKAEGAAVRICPIDTGLLRTTIVGEADETSMLMRLSAGDATQANYAVHVEMGTSPHAITSHGPWPLRNRETGEVFGQSVNHPGTQAQPYLRPAIETIGR